MYTRVIYFRERRKHWIYKVLNVSMLDHLLHDQNWEMEFINICYWEINAIRCNHCNKRQYQYVALREQKTEKNVNIHYNTIFGNMHPLNNHNFK